MRRLLLYLVILAVLLVVVIPVSIIYLTNSYQFGDRVKVTPGGIQLKVLLADQGQIKTMDLEEYLIGTVAAEMPVLFELEALKAQAVAARTYALKRRDLVQKQENPHHPGAHICTDSTHCQAWLSTKELKDRWGLIQYYSYRKKIQRAVRETAGVVLTYEGKLIDPVYHSTSNGRTENAGEVWKFHIPYLQSVESPWDLESPKYHAQISYQPVELAQRLGMEKEDFTGSETMPFQILEVTDGGRIKRIQVGEKTLTGEEFRRLLNLNSAAVSWEAQGDQVVFTTKGYGHGVGMSQYGANGMAREGKNYQQILNYYYTGVQLYRITQ